MGNFASSLLTPRAGAGQPSPATPWLSPSDLARAVSDVADDPGRWLGLVRYDPEARWYLRLAHDDAHEVWLLSWLPGQGTGFHDHGASGGAFAVARGVLHERLAPGGRACAPGTSLPAGAVRSFGASYVHDLANASGQPAVSVHAYSPPLTSMRRFAPGPGGTLRLVAEEFPAEDRPW